MLGLRSEILQQSKSTTVQRKGRSTADVSSRQTPVVVINAAATNKRFTCLSFLTSPSNNADYYPHYGLRCLLLRLTENQLITLSNHGSLYNPWSNANIGFISLIFILVCVSTTGQPIVFLGEQGKRIQICTRFTQSWRAQNGSGWKYWATKNRKLR